MSESLTYRRYNYDMMFIRASTNFMVVPVILQQYSANNVNQDGPEASPSFGSSYRLGAQGHFVSQFGRLIP
jgi:hypothetical protein